MKRENRSLVLVLPWCDMEILFGSFYFISSHVDEIMATKMPNHFKFKAS